MNKKQCKICRETNPKTKIIYSLVQGDHLCVDCYRSQFPLTPIYPISVKITH